MTHQEEVLINDNIAAGHISGITSPFLSTGEEDCPMLLILFNVLSSMLLKSFLCLLFDLTR